MNVSISTTALPSMRAFYESAVGLPVMDEGEDHVWFRGFGGAVEVQLELARPGDERHEPQFMCIHTAQAAKYAERFEKLDVPFTIRSRASAVEVNVSDPDGNKLLLTTEKKPK